MQIDTEVYTIYMGGLVIHGVHSNNLYGKVWNSKMPPLERKPGFFQIAYEGDFWPLCTLIFRKKT